MTKRANQIPRLSSLRRAPTQARGSDSVLNILRACETLLVKTPFDQLTIEEIAAQANVNVGSVYFFFRDKTSIFCSLIELLLREIMAEYRLSRRDLEDSFEDYLARLYGRLTRLWKRSRPLRGIWLAYRSHPYVWSVLQELWQTVDGEMEKKLRTEFPSLGANRRGIAARVINASIASSLDSAALLAARKGQSFRAESLLMISEYARRFESHPRARRLNYRRNQ